MSSPPAAVADQMKINNIICIVYGGLWYVEVVQTPKAFVTSAVNVLFYHSNVVLHRNVGKFHVDTTRENR